MHSHSYLVVAANDSDNSSGLMGLKGLPDNYRGKAYLLKKLKESSQVVGVTHENYRYSQEGLGDNRSAN